MNILDTTARLLGGVEPTVLLKKAQRFMAKLRAETVEEQLRHFQRNSARTQYGSSQKQW